VGLKEVPLPPIVFVRADSKGLMGEWLVSSGEIWKRGRDREFLGLKDVTPHVLEKEPARC